MAITLLLILCMSLVLPLLPHFLFEKRAKKTKELYIFFDDCLHWVEASLFFKVNLFRNKPKGLQALMESLWPIWIASLLGALIISLLAKYSFDKDLTLAQLFSQNDSPNYFYLLASWFGLVAACFANYLIRVKSHADKWLFCNKELIEIRKNKPVNYQDALWKRWGHDLVVTGMWGHRSFAKEFVIIINEVWKIKNGNKPLPNNLSEQEALELLS